MSLVLTPTEELLMEVMAARYRLGEPIWTFDSRHKRVLESLASRGLCRTMHGIVERTVRAGLTEMGKEEYLDPRYVPPVLSKKKKKKGKK